MFNILATSKSGMNAYQEKLDYLSNDLANVNTTAYKSTDVGFKDLLTESLDRKGTPLVDKTAVNGTGVRTGMNYANNKQGNLITTGGNTDLAIDGEGYFAVTKSDGSIAYTRDGNLKIDANGVLVDSSGSKLYIEYMNGASEGMPMLKDKEVSFSSDGTIMMITDDGTRQEIGRIPIYTSIGDKSFLPQGNNYFIPADDATVQESTDYDIRQGMLEASNVDSGETFTEIVLSQRAFQLNAKAVTVADELWGMVNGLR